MVFNLLAIPFGYIGLAIATSMSATLNAALLYITLHKQGVFVLSRTSVMFILRVLIASTVMGAVIFYRDKGVEFFDLEWIVQVMDVAITIALSAAAFFSCMILLGARRRHFKSGGG